MKFGELIENWLEIITPIRSPRTISAYRSALKHTGDNLWKTPVDDVTAAAWQLAVNQTAASWPRQAQLQHAAFRAAWRFGQRMGMILPDHSPYLYVAPPEHHHKPILYLTPAEMSSYCREARHTPAALPLLLMLLLGLRRGEALAVKWSQIDRRSMILYIDSQIVNGERSKPKSRSSVRKVPICADILRIFDEYGDKTGYLCYNGSVGMVYASHAMALERARLPAGITLHGLRHSCATAALSGGVPVTAVQHLLGHAHFSTTADIYSHVLIEPVREAVSTVIGLAM